MYEDLRRQLNDIANAQWYITMVGGDDSSLANAYDSLRDTFDDLKDGEVQADNADVVWQLNSTVDQMVAAGETLYITLVGLEQQAAEGQRSLAALDRSLEELRLRQQLGQVSRQTVDEVEAQRTQVVSQLNTLDTTITTYKSQLQTLIGEEPTGEITLGVPGEHNVYNALAAIALCRDLGIDMEHIRAGLKKFTGTNRRFEKKGEIGGVTIIDDYAHHPQEIAATLEAAKNYPHKKLWCVFQPHTYTRTKAFLDQFAQALSAADEVVLADIYAARETDTLGISSADIAERIEKLGTKAHYFKSFDEIETFLLENCMHGDLLITMGAGDIVKVGENLLGE